MNDLQLEKKIRQDTAKVRKDLKTLADDSAARLEPVRKQREPGHR